MDCRSLADCQVWITRTSRPATACWVLLLVLLREHWWPRRSRVKYHRIPWHPLTRGVAQERSCRVEELGDPDTLCSKAYQRSKLCDGGDSQPRWFAPVIYYSPQ